MSRLQKPMQLLGNVVRIARSRPRLAPSESRPVVRAHPRGPCKLRLKAAPDQRVIAQPGVENHRRGSAPCAIHVHRAAVHLVHLPGRRIMHPKPKQRRRVVSRAPRKRHRNHHHNRKNNAFNNTPTPAPGLHWHREQGPQRQPHHYNSGQQNQSRNNNIVHIHSSPRPAIL